MHSEKITRRKKLFNMLSYSSGDLLGGGVLQVTQMYYLSFLLYVMGLDPLLAALVPAIGKIWDGVTDPIMGVIVDRTRTKYGSCRPWFLIAVVPIFVTYFLLWYSFGIASQWGMFIYFSFAYILFSTAYTIAVVPYEALLPRMVDSYDERTNYSSLRMIFSGIGCVASTYIYERIVATETLSYA
ncbi:MAG: MFS transporter, partial [Clostridia bacterium]|nr:MFS transporter [Clostridia bacterium]